VLDGLALVPCRPRDGRDGFFARRYACWTCLTTPARMTVEWSYATEHADREEFFRLTVTSVQSLGQHRARHAARPP
jgi:hypothetical protein